MQKNQFLNADKEKTCTNEKCKNTRAHSADTCFSKLVYLLKKQLGAQTNVIITNNAIESKVEIIETQSMLNNISKYLKDEFKEVAEIKTNRVEDKFSAPTCEMIINNTTIIAEKLNIKQLTRKEDKKVTNVYANGLIENVEIVEVPVTIKGEEI